MTEGIWSLQTKIQILEDRVRKHDDLLLEMVDKLRNFVNARGKGLSPDLLFLMGEITGMILRSGVKKSG